MVSGRIKIQIVGRRHLLNATQMPPQKGVLLKARRMQEGGRVYVSPPKPSRPICAPYCSETSEMPHLRLPSESRDWPGHQQECHTHMPFSHYSFHPIPPYPPAHCGVAGQWSPLLSQMVKLGSKEALCPARPWAQISETQHSCKTHRRPQPSPIPHMLPLGSAGLCWGLEPSEDLFHFLPYLLPPARAGSFLPFC